MNTKEDDDLARFVLRCIRGCATDDQYMETLQRVKTAFVSVRDDATTSMRCACVEKVRSIAAAHRVMAEKFKGKAIGEMQTIRAEECEIIARSLESVSIKRIGD